MSRRASNKRAVRDQQTSVVWSAVTNKALSLRRHVDWSVALRTLSTATHNSVVPCVESLQPVVRLAALRTGAVWLI